MGGKKIAFVMGPPCSGKATFVKRRFPDYKVVDLHEIQQRGVSVWDSYLIARDELVQAIKDYDKVVLRHTLVKAKRRPMYVEAVRSVLGSDAEIACYYSLPSIDVCQHYDELDLESWNREHPERRDFPTAPSRLLLVLEEFDIPTESEGFSEVHHIQSLPEGIPDWEREGERGIK